MASPDGYTVGLGGVGTHAASVQLNPKLPFDPPDRFDYLGLVSSTPSVLFVRKDFPASTLKEYIAYAKAKGKDLKLGHSGIGSASHITIVLLSQLIGVEPTMVAYRGFGQTGNDILSGAIDGSCDLVAAVSGHVQGGSLKALVVAAAERSPAVPDVPTANEAGLPGVQGGNLDRSLRAEGDAAGGAGEGFRGDHQDLGGPCERQAAS